MSKLLACAATPGSGVRHRLLMLSAAKYFADSRGYSVSMLWGLTRGVSHCRFEELFAPIPGIQVINIPAEQLAEVADCARSKRNMRFAGRLLRVLRPGQAIKGDLFSWDLNGSAMLAGIVSGPTPQIV